jgi:hypothetical protein
MNKRLELHEILCEIINIIEPDGDRHTYFDPPESVKMRYPAIRYSLTDIDKLHANNSAYRLQNSYTLTVIGTKPNDKYVQKLLQLPYCSFVRHYKANNLNHDVLTIYY